MGTTGTVEYNKEKATLTVTDIGGLSQSVFPVSGAAKVFFDELSKATGTTTFDAFVKFEKTTPALIIAQMTFGYGKDGFVLNMREGTSKIFKEDHFTGEVSTVPMSSADVKALFSKPQVKKTVVTQ